MKDFKKTFSFDSPLNAGEKILFKYINFFQNSFSLFKYYFYN